MPEIVNNRKIAKNTLYLYVRMIISMVVSLYTARVIINVLGLEDYGIYNIVGGVVILFSFLNIALRNSTQRYVSYELGKNSVMGVNKVMNMSLQCHLLYSVIILLLSLSIGLWFVYNKLHIPDDRMNAAVIVYLISILTFIVNVFQAPYHAAIISYERMSFYAVISIFDVSFKLLIVYVLLVVGGDKLIIYSVLVLVVTLFSLIVVIWYSYRNLQLYRPYFVKDAALFRQFFSYAGWSMFSGCSYIGAQQGGNILINIFNGVAANGAYAIANQASNVLYGFVSNFQSAFNPQIVKSYSSKKFDELFVLMNRASYFSYYLFLIMAVPLMMEMDYVMQLWLGDVPNYATNFCRLMIIYFLVDAFEAPLWMLIGATGKMKVYSFWQGTITLLNLPISWFLLVIGYSVYSVFVVRVIINIVTAVLRPFILKHIMPQYSLYVFGRLVLRYVFVVTSILCVGIYIINLLLGDSHPLLLMSYYFILTMIVVFTIGLKNNDKIALLNMVKSKIKK